MRRLGVRPGDDSSSSVFRLPNHVANNLSPEESANVIADHFSSISLDYDPIDVNSFSPKLKDAYNAPDISKVPVLTDYDVYHKIKRAKKPNSSVTSDLPRKLVKEFSRELAYPISVIFNSILRSLEYPRQWVVEHQTPIPKVYPPQSENDLRNIAKTSFFSKVFESYLSDLLLPYVQPYLDPMQFGLKGGSINHYLIKLLRFIHTNLDLKDPHAVVLALVDLSKAFNRISHLLVIEDLHDMHVPAWLLRILTSYLTERSMVLTYDGAKSSPRSLPGSSPQGAFLGIFLFIIKFNGVSLRPPIYRQCCSLKHDSSTHMIYIDDLSEAASFRLKNLSLASKSRPHPLPYHERTGHCLPAANVLQENLNKVEEFTKKNLMKINHSKSNTMLFNISKTLDFPPEFTFSDGEILKCVEESKLLGVVISSNLKWHSNTSHIVKKAMSRMWLLRRMKHLKLDNHFIFDYYIKEIRPVAEFGAVVWHSGITTGQKSDIERIQKVAFKIILSDSYTSYTRACADFNVQSLEERRIQLCTKFAIKLYNSDRRRQFFEPAIFSDKTRSKKPLVKEEVSRTKRCFSAPHNFLARIINSNQDKIKVK